MSGHTPGPWTLHEDESIRDINYNIIADVLDSTEADARLMAAAPDLLEALKAYRRPAQWNHSEGCFCETCEMVRAAIAKAEGRS